MGAEPSIELILQGDVKVNWCEETLVAGRGFLRGCADRSWLPGRSAFPTVAHPAFSDQPPHDDDHLRERHPEIDHPSHALRAPHKLLVGVVPKICPFHHPSLSGL